MRCPKDDSLSITKRSWQKNPETPNSDTPSPDAANPGAPNLGATNSGLMLVPISSHNSTKKDP